MFTLIFFLGITKITKIVTSQNPQGHKVSIWVGPPLVAPKCQRGRSVQRNKLSSNIRSPETVQKNLAIFYHHLRGFQAVRENKGVSSIPNMPESDCYCLQTEHILRAVRMKIMEEF